MDAGEAVSSATVQATVETARRDDEVLRVYERLVASQPQLVVEGLFESDGTYTIVCAGYAKDTEALDGTPLARWMFEGMSLFLPDLVLAAEAPTGARRVHETGKAGAIELRGSFRFIPNLRDDLALELGAFFPEFALEKGDEGVELRVERPLTEEQLDILSNTI